MVVPKLRKQINRTYNKISGKTTKNDDQLKKTLTLSYISFSFYLLLIFTLFE